MSYQNGQQRGDAGFPTDALDRVTDPEDYSALKLVRSIWEARQTVLERKGLAYEAFWDGRINREDYQKALRMAVEDFIRQSQWTIRRHKYGMWFWEGLPPTTDGRDPFERDGDGQFIRDDDGEPKLRALRPDEVVELPGGDEARAGDIVADGGGYRLTRPLLAVDEDSGQPPFGTRPNVLGTLEVPQKDRTIPFVGLKSVFEFPDPLRVEWDEVESHPQRIRQPATKQATYQLPERVSMAAFDLVCEFWEGHAGLGLDHDRGLPRQTGINFAAGDKGRVERGDPY